MKTLTVNIPDQANLDARDVVKFLAAKLYEAGKLSLGQAAEVAGFSKRTFAEILSDYGVSLFNYPVDEIKKDTAQI